jgi:hypothetical protein
LRNLGEYVNLKSDSQVTIVVDVPMLEA